jgi:hypothetical protein
MVTSPNSINWLVFVMETILRQELKYYLNELLGFKGLTLWR